MSTANNAAQQDPLPKEFFQEIFLQAGDGIFLTGEDSTILEANPRGCEMLGYAREELLGRPVLQFQPPDVIEDIRQKLALLTVQKLVTAETVFLRKDGTRMPVEITGRLLSNNQIIGMLRDITERKAAQQALIENEEKYRSLVEHSPDGIILVDEKGRVIEWNLGQQWISGLKESETLGRHIWDIQVELMPKDQRSHVILDQIRQRTLDVLRSGRETWPSNQPIEGKIELRDGTIRSVEVMMYIYKTALGYRLGSITRDISRRKQVELLLEYMAMHDALTDLPNRLLFENRLIHALDRAKRDPEKQLAVMMLDLDNFKEVNDAFGHAFGDQLLKVVGQRLQNCLRKSDTAARMGGDEFAVISEGISDVADIQLVADKILRAISMPVELESQVVHLTTSIGISIHNFRNSDAGQLLREADLAMYEAKRSRNCSRFYSLP